MNTKPVPEDIQLLLKEVRDHFNDEDVAVRERQIRTWRRLKLYWEGFQNIWYSEVAHDWRIWDQDAYNDGDTEQSYYDKQVNVFRAYLESIIAALSVTVPPIKCYPDDADNTLDLSTAKAGDKISELIYRHNNVPLLWLHALFVFVTEGMVACYSYPKEDEKYGTYDNPKYEDVTELHDIKTCPNCGYQISDNLAPPMNPEGAEAGLDTAEMGSPQLNGGQPNQELKVDEFQPYDYCESCNMEVPAISKQENLIVTRLVGITQEPKSRICLEVYGGLNIKVPNYARRQEDIPYLRYSYETHYANAIERYAHLHGKKGLTAQKIEASTGPTDPYEEWGRLSPQYQGEYPNNAVTIENYWFRPCAWNVISDPDGVKKLHDYFPKGCKVVHVNDEFGEAIPEVLDDCWTLSYNPLADFIHYNPLGSTLVPLQEITNDMVSLILQTIEHGIGQTFADPSVLNFNAYRQLEAIPGGIYEATPKSGKSLNDAFHEVKTASLSPEVMPFAQNIQTLAQLVSGALPSLFGGQIGGSETASEYSMSRAQALQRLQNNWKIFTTWWKEIFGKVIPMFIQEMQDDERDVQRDQNGNFINVFIRKAEMEGRIGKVELEANENLPLTWTQVKDQIMKMLEQANPLILEYLGSPENLPVLREAIGLTNFYVPGEDDRNKQYDEIKLLLNSEPIMTENPEMPEMPSVEIDPIYDNHGIEFEIVRKWVVSDAGRQAKNENPPGYKNVLLHGLMHYQMIQQQAMQAQGAVPEEKPDDYNREAPIEGEGSVPTVQ